jgi:hypothetical protein
MWENPMTENPTVRIKVETAPKKEWKAFGGGDRDQWNERLLTLVTRALPVDQRNAESVSHAGSAVMAGVVDMNPADPVEGLLISQLVVAHEAALSMYQLAWAQPPEYFEARMKYLARADKASRTVAMLTERLDHHRGRGQQQIVVKHVTVNTDQAMITDTIVTGGRAGDTKPCPALLTDPTEKPMSMLEETSEPVGCEKKE